MSSIFVNFGPLANEFEFAPKSPKQPIHFNITSVYVLEQLLSHTNSKISQINKFFRNGRQSDDTQTKYLFVSNLSPNWWKCCVRSIFHYLYATAKFFSSTFQFSRLFSSVRLSLFLLCCSFRRRRRTYFTGYSTTTRSFERLTLS